MLDCYIALPGVEAQTADHQVALHVIGLTGGIGVGKSEVAATLERLGANVIDADREGHEAYAKGTIGWRRIAELFGEGVLTEDQEVDRRKLGKLVFSNPQALAWLNAAIHPIIKERIAAKLNGWKAEGCAVAAIDAAVLVQAGWHDLADEVWFVRSPRSDVVERIARQRGLQSWEVQARIDAQQAMMQESEAKADVVIDNSGTVEDLRAQVEQLWTERNLPIRQH